jgi:hypothetical protein
LLILPVIVVSEYVEGLVAIRAAGVDGVLKAALRI